MAEKDTFEEIFDEVATETDGSDTPGTETETVDEEKATQTQESSTEKTEKTGELEKKPTYEELEQNYKSLQGMFEAETTKTKDLEGKVKGFEEKVKKEPEKTEEKGKTETEEPDSELDNYLREYDYIAKNEGKLRKKELEALKKEIVKEISETFDIPLKTVNQLVEDKINEDYETHKGAIMESHPDYGKAFKKKDVEEWIETLTPTTSKAFKAIFEDGETEEVIELLSIFKEAKGIVEKTDDNDNKNENLNEEKIKKEKEKQRKLDESETVKGGKQAVGGTIKKADNFEDAFEEAVKTK